MNLLLSTNSSTAMENYQKFNVIEHTTMVCVALFWYYKLKSCTAQVIRFSCPHPLDFSFFPKIWMRGNVHVIRLKRVFSFVDTPLSQTCAVNVLRFIVHMTDTSLQQILFIGSVEDFYWKWSLTDTLIRRTLIFVRKNALYNTLECKQKTKNLPHFECSRLAIMIHKIDL